MTTTNPNASAQTTPPRPAFRLAGLSPRCREVLNGVIAGQSNKLIAHNLGISLRTVETYRSRAIRKLGARDASEAVRLALEAIAAEPWLR